MAREVARGVLHAREPGARELARERGLEVVHRARRDVVEERRRVAGGLEHGEEMRRTWTWVTG